MKRSAQTVLFVLSMFSTVASAAAEDSRKIEIYCQRPNQIYDLSIWIRNSYSQGGPFDGSLMVYINGGYVGVGDVARFTNAFGKGNAVDLDLEEKAWKDCTLSQDGNHLSCDLIATDHPFDLFGQKDFDAGLSTIIQASRYGLQYDRNPETKMGHFRFDVTEAGTGVAKTIEYDLPCGN